MTDDEPADEMVERLVWRILAARADQEKIAQILKSMLADFGESHAFGELFGMILAELLSVTDGLIEEHPRGPELRMIYAAKAEIAELTDGDG